MRGRLLVFLILGVSLVFALLFARELHLAKSLPREKFVDKKLKILTYSTFVSASGPGGEILDRFKAAHDCELEVIVVNDAGLILPRLKLTPGVDVVIGLDQFMVAAAEKQSDWSEVQISREGWAKDLSVSDDKFIPFDWSPLTFIYRAGSEPPKTFADLESPRFKGQFALQNPHTSSPGLDFMIWAEAVEGANAEKFLSLFKANVQSVSPNWVYSYGLFKDKKAAFVFSYVTSLAFHWGVEKDLNYRAVSFPEGHPIQTEYMAVPAGCKECELGKALVKEFLKPDAQRIVMLKNYMRPVISAVEEGTLFAKLPQLKVLPIKIPATPDFKTWDGAF